MPDRTFVGQTFANGWPPASVRIRTVPLMTKRHPERRTALITAGGIAAVVVAGAFAVGANIGILDASSDNQIGALAAAGDLVPTTAPAMAPITTGDGATPATAGPQTYLVDVAGTVDVGATGDGVAVSAVVANPGWTWTAGPSDATHVQLTFTDGVRSLVFTATRADESIAAGVEEATSSAASAASATTAPSSYEDADDHDEREDEHEGRDDDD